MPRRFTRIRNGIVTVVVIAVGAVTTTGIILFGGADRAPSNLYVSPNGLDTNNCLSRQQPCKTLGKAVELAGCGTVIEMAGGIYVSKNSGADISFFPYQSGCATNPVVIRSLGGGRKYLPNLADASTNQAIITHAPSGTFVGFEVGSSLNCPKHIVFDRVYFDTTVVVNGCVAEGTSSIVTFQNLVFDSRSTMALFRSQLEGTSNKNWTQGFQAASTDGLTFRRVTFGPTCCDNDTMGVLSGVGAPVPENVLFDDVTTLDTAGSCVTLAIALWPNCETESNPHTTNHVDVYQSYGARNVTIRNSRFYSCAKWQSGADTTWELGSPARSSDHLYINNVWDCPATFRLECTGGGSSCTDVNTPTYAIGGYIKFYYNTFTQRGLTIGDADPNGQYEFVGNLVGDTTTAGGFCTLGVDGAGTPHGPPDVAINNMFESGAENCGPTNVNGEAIYRDSTPFEYPYNHKLASNSPGLNAGESVYCPLGDNIFNARPIGTACDIGAIESG